MEGHATQTPPRLSEMTPFVSARSSAAIIPIAHPLIGGATFPTSTITGTRAPRGRVPSLQPGHPVDAGSASSGTNFEICEECSGMRPIGEQHVDGP